MTSTAVVFFTIVVDVLYTVIDPRIRLESPAFGAAKQIAPKQRET